MFYNQRRQIIISLCLKLQFPVWWTVQQSGTTRKQAILKVIKVISLIEITVLHASSLCHLHLLTSDLQGQRGRCSCPSRKRPTSSNAAVAAHPDPMLSSKVAALISVSLLDL